MYYMSIILLFGYSLLSVVTKFISNIFVFETAHLVFVKL